MLDALTQNSEKADTNTSTRTYTHCRHIILECKHPHSIKHRDIIAVKLDMHSTVVPIKC